MKPDLELLVSVQAEGLVRRRRRGVSTWFVSVPFDAILKLVRTHARLRRRLARVRQIEREAAIRNGKIADLEQMLRAKDVEVGTLTAALARLNGQHVRTGAVQTRSERSALNAAIDRETDFRRQGFAGGLAGL